MLGVLRIQVAETRIKQNKTAKCDRRRQKGKETVISYFLNSGQVSRAGGRTWSQSLRNCLILRFLCPLSKRQRVLETQSSEA